MRSLKEALLVIVLGSATVAAISGPAFVVFHDEMPRAPLALTVVAGTTHAAEAPGDESDKPLMLHSSAYVLSGDAYGVGRPSLVGPAYYSVLDPSFRVMILPPFCYYQSYWDRGSVHAPEPTSMFLLTLGAVLIARYRR